MRSITERLEDYIFDLIIIEDKYFQNQINIKKVISELIYHLAVLIENLEECSELKSTN